MVEATYRVTPSHVFDGRRRYRRQGLGYWPILAFKVVVVSILIALGFRAFEDAPKRLAGFYTFLAVIVCFGRVADRWAAHRLFRNLPNRNEEVRLEFDDSGLRTRTAREESELPWSAFTAVAHFKDGFLLFRSRSAYFWIPVTAFRDEAALTHWERCLATIRRRRVIRRIVSPFAVRRKWWQAPPTTWARWLAASSWLAPLAALNLMSLEIGAFVMPERITHALGLPEAPGFFFVGAVRITTSIFPLLFAAGVLLALGIVLGGTALVMNWRHRQRGVSGQAMAGTGISVLIATVWLLTQQFGARQVQASALAAVPHPPSSTDVSSETPFSIFGSLPTPIPKPPYHYCITRAHGPCLVVASRAAVNQSDASGRASLYLWTFGGFRELGDLVFWDW